MQILGFLGMYFEAVVSRSRDFFTFIQIGSGHTVGDAQTTECRFLPTKNMDLQIIIFYLTTLGMCSKSEVMLT